MSGVKHSLSPAYEHKLTLKVTLLRGLMQKNPRGKFKRGKPESGNRQKDRRKKDGKK